LIIQDTNGKKREVEWLCKKKFTVMDKVNNVPINKWYVVAMVKGKRNGNKWRQFYLYTDFKKYNPGVKVDVCEGRHNTDQE